MPTIIMSAQTPCFPTKYNSCNIVKWSCTFPEHYTQRSYSTDLMINVVYFYVFMSVQFGYPWSCTYFRSKSELAGLLQALSSSNKRGNARRVRVVGAGHSWSAVAQSDEIQVSMSNFKVSASKGRWPEVVTTCEGTNIAANSNPMVKSHDSQAISPSILSQQNLACQITYFILSELVSFPDSTFTKDKGLAYFARNLGLPDLAGEE